MPKHNFINVSKVRELTKVYDKQVSKDFLTALDRLVHKKILTSCMQFNGHKKRLTSAELIGGLK